MVLFKIFSLLFVCCFCTNIVSAGPSFKYNSPDVTEDWKPANALEDVPTELTKSNGIQDRFHPVTINHVKHVPGKQSQLIQQPQNQNTQAIILPFNHQGVNQQGFSQQGFNQQTFNQQNVNQQAFNQQSLIQQGFNQQSASDEFRNEFPQFQQGQIIQVDNQPESHAGEIIPELVNPEALQSLDFPMNKPTYHISVQPLTPTPSPSPTPTEKPSSESLKTVYVPWIYIPPSPTYKDDSRSVVKPPGPDYPSPKPNYTPPIPGYPSAPPKPTYLPPEPNYLPPEPTYLPPKPTYLPPEPGYLPPLPPPKPTYLPPTGYSYPPPSPPPNYLPPKPGYLPPNPGYLPPDPGYSYPPPPLPIEEEKEKAAEFTYFFLGRKLWYIPLYFSIYFVLYVGYLVVKAIARHKLKFPHLLHNASVVAGRDLIQLGLFNSRDFNDMDELLNAITKAFKSD